MQWVPFWLSELVFAVEIHLVHQVSGVIPVEVLFEPILELRFGSRRSYCHRFCRWFWSNTVLLVFQLLVLLTGDFNCRVFIFIHWSYVLTPNFAMLVMSGLSIVLQSAFVNSAVVFLLPLVKFVLFVGCIESIQLVGACQNLKLKRQGSVFRNQIAVEVAVNFLSSKSKVGWTLNFDGVTLTQHCDWLIPAFWNLVVALLETSRNAYVFGIKNQDLLVMVLHPSLVVHMKPVEWFAVWPVGCLVIQDADWHEVLLNANKAFLSYEQI